MTNPRERVRVLRKVEHVVVTSVEGVNGIVDLLKELDRDDETSVAVAAAHCLRRIFTRLLDPEKNPQLPRQDVIDLLRKSEGGANGGALDNSDGMAQRSKRKKRPRRDDADVSLVASNESAAAAGGAGAGDGEGDKAARAYQSWLEARYVDFLRVLLGWVAEVEDFHRQGPALRTLMHFVEIEPTLCFTAAQLSNPTMAPRAHSGGVGGGVGGVVSGEGTIWGGVFAETMRAIILGPCSLQPKLLKVLGEDYVNVHDDVRYFLLGNVTDIARRAVADSAQRGTLPVHSPLRGYRGPSAAFGPEPSPRRSAGLAEDGDEKASGKTSKSGRKRHKKGASEPLADPSQGQQGTQEGRGEPPVGDETPHGARMDLLEVGTRLAQVMMVVRMVEEQSDLTGYLLPVGLSVPRKVGGGGGGGSEGEALQVIGYDVEDNSSSSSSESDGESDGDAVDDKKTRQQRGAGPQASKSDGKKNGGAIETLRETRKEQLAIERLRYHKKAFGDAWLSCLRLPLSPATYRRVLLFLPGNVIPYMPSPVRLADFLSQAYSGGGMQAVLALDALFLLMQAHDLDYPDFYDSLYRLATPMMMYAKYRARYFRMVDLCLSSSHVPAYVVAAFLKRFSRTALQAPPSGALFTLALARKLIGRHPECLSLISSHAVATLPAPTGTAIVGGGDPKDGSKDGSKDGKAFVDEYDATAERSEDAGALRTSLWELAALQDHYHPAVATLARGFLRQADKKEAEGEAFAAPAKLAGETYQSLFGQESRRKMGKVALAFRPPKGLFDDIPEEGGGVFAAVNFTY